MKNCHLAYFNLFMVKPFYLTITTFLEDGFSWFNKSRLNILIQLSTTSNKSEVIAVR